MSEELPIKFSDAAAVRVKQLIEEEENPDLKLRVYVTGGGCSGFQYGFTFDENQKESQGALLLLDIFLISLRIKLFFISSSLKKSSALSPMLIPSI